MPAEFCTIYCGHLDRANLPDILALLPDITVTSLTTETPWTKLQVAAPGGEMIFTAIAFEQGGDYFSRSLLGLINHARLIRTDHADNKDSLIKWLSRCRLAIGVKAPTGFADEGMQEDLVLLTAKLMDGILFMGDRFYTPMCKIILGADGMSETAI